MERRYRLFTNLRQIGLVAILALGLNHSPLRLGSLASEHPPLPISKVLVKNSNNAIGTPHQPITADALRTLGLHDTDSVVDEILGKIGWGVYLTSENTDPAYRDELRLAGFDVEDDLKVGGLSEEFPDLPFDDPKRADQWEFDYMGFERAYGHILSAIPPEGHSRPGGKIRVAIVDSGIASPEQNADVPHVVKAMTTFDDEDEYDRHGHGTMTASVLALTDNAFGISGVCPQHLCETISAKVLDGSPTGNPSGGISQVVAGIIWSVDQGAHVINLSLGIRTDNPPDIFFDAIKYALDRGVIVVAASGNDGMTTPMYPAAAEGVIAVGSHYSSGVPREGASYPDKPDRRAVLAPQWTQSLAFENRFQIAAGTSRSAPYVSALAALLLSMGATPEMAINAILNGARDIGDPGYDAISGHGNTYIEGSIWYLMNTYGWSPKAQVYLPYVSQKSHYISYLPMILDP